MGGFRDGHKGLLVVFAGLRDIIRLLWTLRPFHRRDVTVWNMVVSCQDQDLRSQETVLRWPNGITPPRLTTMLIDYERGRWSSEPSEHRRRTEAGLSAEGSFDDCNTATIGFLSRPQRLLLP